MTEKDWLASTRVYDLTHHESSRSDRKRRLLGCACARRMLRFVSDLRLVRAIEAAERHADGELGWPHLKQIRREVAACRREMQAKDCLEYEWNASHAIEVVTAKDALSAAHAIEPAQYAAAAFERPNWDTGRDAEEREQMKLTRDIFGNPFRPLAFDPSWRTTTAASLARTMYESRDFAAMPVLADALEDAGCDNAEVLAHCRGDGPHVRGCWVVDLVLGKS